MLKLCFRLYFNKFALFHDKGFTTILWVHKIKPSYRKFHHTMPKVLSSTHKKRRNVLWLPLKDLTSHFYLSWRSFVQQQTGLHWQLSLSTSTQWSFNFSQVVQKDPHVSLPPFSNFNIDMQVGLSLSLQTTKLYSNNNAAGLGWRRDLCRVCLPTPFGGGGWYPLQGSFGGGELRLIWLAVCSVCVCVCVNIYDSQMSTHSLFGLPQTRPKEK